MALIGLAVFIAMIGVLIGLWRWVFETARASGTSTADRRDDR